MLQRFEKVYNYFDNVSNNEKKDLACEIILELGDKEYWDTKDEDFKKKMSEVYKKQVDDLEMLIPNFKVASAVIHFDETSPHLHTDYSSYFFKFLYKFENSDRISTRKEDCLYDRL